jgi:phosphoadenosine phosphosulfate reductase
MINLQLESKIAWSEQVILKALKENNNPAVSISWGKDSIVMLDLVRRFCKNTFVLYANTLCEYPETYKYRDKMLKGYFKDINYVETRPIKSFWQCVEEYGFPHTRQNSKQDKKGQKKKRTPACCKYLKEKPLMDKEKELGVDCVFIGLQATESMNRRLLYLRMGEYYFNKTEKRNKCYPLAIWTNKDVWDYAKQNKIPMCDIYKKMERNGCMFCTGFKDWEKVMSKYNPNLTAIIKTKMGEPVISDCFKGV